MQANVSALTGDHHEQPHAKAADGCGQDKGADAKGGADLPAEKEKENGRIMKFPPSI